MLHLLTEKQRHAPKQYDDAAILQYGIRASMNAFSRFSIFGLQYCLDQYFTKPILIKEEILECKASFPDFDEEPWLALCRDHKGYLPVRINTQSEGTIWANERLQDFLAVTVINTDPNYAWIVPVLEPLLKDAIDMTYAICEQSTLYVSLRDRYEGRSLREPFDIVINNSLEPQMSATYLTKGVLTTSDRGSEFLKKHYYAQEIENLIAVRENLNNLDLRESLTAPTIVSIRDWNNVKNKIQDNLSVLNKNKFPLILEYNTHPIRVGESLIGLMEQAIADVGTKTVPNGVLINGNIIMLPKTAMTTQTFQEFMRYLYNFSYLNRNFLGYHDITPPQNQKAVYYAPLYYETKNGEKAKAYYGGKVTANGIRIVNTNQSSSMYIVYDHYKNQYPFAYSDGQFKRARTVSSSSSSFFPNYVTTSSTTTGNTIINSSVVYRPH